MPVLAEASAADEERIDADISGRTVRDFTRLTVKDAVEEFMFLGLRMTEGVTDQAFRQSFGMALSDVYGEQIKELSERGLLTVTRDGGDTRIALTPRGTDVSNVVLSEFLLDI